MIPRTWTICILLVGLLFHNCFSQNWDNSPITINYSAENVPISQVFSEIEKKYDLRFSYASQSVEKRIVNLDLSDASIEDMMSLLLEDKDMEYRLIENNILIRKANSFVGEDDQNYRKSLHLKGAIKSTEEEALPYASIAVSNSAVGTYSDESGSFDLEISPEYFEEEIIIHSLGYEDVVYRIKDLDDRFLIVPMNQGGFEMEEIVIVNNSKPIEILSYQGALSMYSTLLDKNTGGIFGRDINRQIQMLPGVAAFDDASSEIKIRGSNSDETLMIMDGMPIYNSSHFYSVFGAFNADYIDQVNLFKNVFPIHYGGKTAGIVELKSHHDIPESTIFNGELNFLTGSVALRQPLGKKSVFDLSYRSTLRGVSNAQFNTVSNENNFQNEIESFEDPIENVKSSPSFNYNDLHAKYLIAFDENTSLSFNYFSSADSYVNNYNFDLKNRNDQKLEMKVKEQADWQTNAASVLFTTDLSPSLNLNASAFYSSYLNDESIKYDLSRILTNVSPLIRSLDAVQENTIKDLGLDTHLSFSTGSSSLVAGLSSTRHDVDYLVEENNNNRLNDQDVNYEHSLYSEYSFTKDRLNFSAGLRGTKYTRKEGVFLSPRILFNYFVTDNLVLKSSYSYYQQAIRKIEYQYRSQSRDLWVHAGRNMIPVIRSQNQMFGLTNKWKALTLDAEFFYKKMNGLIEFAVLRPGNPDNDPTMTRETGLFIGEGRSYGVDLLFSYGIKKYDTYLSYTWSKTEERFKEIFRNNYYPSENDRRHQLKWINMINTDAVIIGIDILYASGRNYTDIRALGPNGDIRDSDPRNRLKVLPAYQRLDASIGREFNLNNMNMGLFFSVFNVLNTKNVKYVQSISEEIEQTQMQAVNAVIGGEAELLNRTYNLRLRIGLK